MPTTRTPRRRIAGVAAAVFAVAAAGTVTATAVDRTADAAEPAACDGVLFDDFAYDNAADPDIDVRGWTVRTNAGGPGVPGASWPASNVSFPTVDGADTLQLRAATDGTGGGTSQSEFLHEQKFFEGTYAARVNFTDTPDSGADGDHLVETFFTITPLDAPLDPDYGEIDFEYLPNGGWGETGPIFYQTTWETYQAEPWIADNTHTSQRQSFDGWHDLVFTVSGGHVKYYVDGQLVADHSGKYYPETPMSINFNLWFIDTAAHTGGTSVYTQQVDYVMHSAGEVLSPADVNARVAGYRADGVDHTDTVGTGGGECPTPTDPPTTDDPTDPPTGGADCATAADWSFATAYNGGATVVHERSAAGDPSGPKSGDGEHLWRAAWWTQGSEPGWTQQWTDLGPC
ncbi:family 16 glycosylhydrolase [Glycomyces harbinensis]|uniref:Beta-glucanase, GH16 family n=1 Tax=Glycomyces harbinensis TaxID=58114 RepID=A0A1G6QS65_9ACTN|nr:family 16 glycosylhydrolase [Glycomyces harbinensis]SDC95168.1 Beta-glucanase, GH16 family [Glycomyces harbinensis]